MNCLGTNEREEIEERLLEESPALIGYVPKESVGQGERKKQSMLWLPMFKLELRKGLASCI